MLEAAAQMQINHTQLQPFISRFKIYGRDRFLYQLFITKLRDFSSLETGARFSSTSGN